jgi:hypothetical protein
MCTLTYLSAISAGSSLSILVVDVFYGRFRYADDIISMYPVLCSQAINDVECVFSY